MMVIVAALVTAAQADVYIVGKVGAEGARDAMETFLTSNFSAGTLGTINKDHYEGSLPPATADDLVIVLRETRSGQYDDGGVGGEVTQWNSLPAPILNMSAYTSELQRWGWTTNGGQMNTATPGAETEVLSPADPLFAGITITGGYADLLIEGIDCDSQNASGLLNAGATMLAEGLQQGGSNRTAVLARIPAGASWSSTVSGGQSGTHAADRILYIAVSNDSVNGINTALTADGQIVLANCLQELFDAKFTPTVDAGSDQEITTLSTSLAGTATDPSDPNGILTYLWTPVAGVTFGTPTDPNTTVTFDDFGIYNLTLTATNSIALTGSDSLSVLVIDPGDATDPDPADGATDVVTAPTLSWTAGLDAVIHDVYFGTSNPPPLVSGHHGSTTYAPGTLIKGQTYYWVVNETDSSAVTHEGFVWSFTVAALSGTTSWTGADPTTNLWSSEDNWDIGVPGIGNQANIQVNGLALIDSSVEAVATGTWARWGIPADPNSDPIVLNMTGGSLTLNRWAVGNGGHAIVNISDGTITTAGLVILGDQPGCDATLNISGGTVEINNTLRMKNIADVDSNVYLTGGVLKANSLDLRTPSDPNYNTIDLAGGTLILAGDDTGVVNDCIGSGRIISYSGTGSVMVSYDLGADETTVTGCPYLLTADATADCVVNGDDLELMVADWLYTTPLEAQWSFDMASDPVGTGELDLKVRGDDPANANYTMGDDTGTGTLEVTGAGTLLLDQQYQGTIGSFDTDVHCVIKSTNDYAVDFWIYMATSQTTGQSTVGFSTMLDDYLYDPDDDPNSIGPAQTVEFWGGRARQQSSYAPFFVEDGLDPDSYLDITVNYDYDTDTYAYIIDDGNGDVRSGTSPVYVGAGTGSGGFYTIKSGTYGGGAGNDAPGAALIDQFDVTIHGSALVIKPGDADRDGDVDLPDFAALAAEWLLDGTL